MAEPWILGISCSHNGSACLLHGDRIVAAVQDERLFRYKRQVTHLRYAGHCVSYCLDAAAIGPEALDLVVYCITRGGGPQPIDDVFLNEVLRLGHHKVPVIGVSHHYAHAVSAFATSGFNEAAVLVIDGSGTAVGALSADERRAIATQDAKDDWVEWLTYYEAIGTTTRPVWKQVFAPHAYDPANVDPFTSLGEMYGAVGMAMFGSMFDGPGKVMGLAPYGRPTIPVDHWLTVEDDGGIQFHADGILAARRHQWPADFGGCADAAASVQHALEHALAYILRQVRGRSRSGNLCYAGGVALNSVANERLVREGGFENVFIFPAAEDSGVAVGAAYHGLWTLTGQNTRRRLCRDSMGRTYDVDDVACAVSRTRSVRMQSISEPAAEVARLLCDGRIVGWFDGGSELGPRSLGHRSILCDPRRRDGKEVLNARVKHREAFRPFAPVVMREHVSDWFDVPPGCSDSPFMLRVWRFLPGRGTLVPAVAHVDDTARVQTVSRNSHPLLYTLLEAFHDRTGVPMLLNTSFNVAGEPIVETPEDALWCLLCTGLDCCVFGELIVHKCDRFQSVLNLSPRVRAQSLTMEIPVVEGRLPPFGVGASIQAPPQLLHRRPLEPSLLRHIRASVLPWHRLQNPVAYASTRTRWGEVAALLDETDVDLLSLMDGQATGHQILEARPAWTEAWLRDTMADLYRQSIIEFV